MLHSGHLHFESFATHYLKFFRRISGYWEFLVLGLGTGLCLFPIPGIQLILLFTISRFVFLIDTPVRWTHFLGNMWAFGFGFFTLSLYWISHALLIELDVFWWLLPFCFFGIPAFLSAVMAFLSIWFLGWSYRVDSKFLRLIFLQFGYANTRCVGRLIMVAFWWVSGEYFLSSFCTGFPWALLGYSWSSVLVVAQTASLGSVYTLSFLTVCMVGTPYLFYSQNVSRFTRVYLVTSSVAAIGLLIFGLIRLITPVELTPTSVRIVHPSIEQTPEWKFDDQMMRLDTLLRLSQLGSRPADVVIWPEAALGFYLEGQALQKRLGRAILPESHLIFGAVRRNDSRTKIWNSLYVLNHQGEIKAVYDKHHLVPFGEYVPLRRWMAYVLPTDKIRKITSGLLDFSEGKGPDVVKVLGFPSFSPMICYEAIFPGQVTPTGRDRPQWLLHMTNDAWFGQSVGPYQHFQIARMRAIEEGLPILRAANAGVSAIIDPYGRILAQRSGPDIGVVEGFLPRALPRRPFCAKVFKLMAWFDQFDPMTRKKN